MTGRSEELEKLGEHVPSAGDPSTVSGSADHPDGDAHPVPVAARRLLRRHWPVVVAFLPAILFLVHTVLETRGGPLIGGDIALIEMSTRSTGSLDAQVGPYSRFGWNHPGPSMFYVFAPFYWVSGQTVGGLGTAAAVLAVGSFVGCAAIVAAVRGRTGSWVFAGVLTLFFSTVGFDWLDNMWNPVIIVAPTVVAGLATAAVAEGRTWGLPIAAAAVSFGVQTHIGTVPVLGVITLVAIVAVVAHARNDARRWLRSIGAAAVVTLAMWMLPLYEQVANDPGNFRELLDRGGESVDSSRSFGDVLDVVVVEFTMSGFDLMDRALIAVVPANSTWRMLWFVALIGAGIAGCVVSIRGRRRFEAVLCGTPPVAIAVLSVSLLGVEGELRPYLTLTAMALGMMLYLGLGLVAVELLRRRVPAARLVPIATVSFVVAGTVLTGAALFGDARSNVVALNPTKPGADATVAALLDELPDDADVLFAMDDGARWPDVALLANQAERSGHPASGEGPDLEFLFGRSRAETGCEDARVLLTTNTQDGVPADAVQVGTIDGAAVLVSRLDPAPTC